MFTSLIGIKLRGSSSAGFFKKQYSIEAKDGSLDLDKNIEFLGMPSEEDWVINGPCTDKSMMRHVITYQMAR